MPFVEELHSPTPEFTGPTLEGVPLDVQRDYLDWLENHPISAHQRRWRLNLASTGFIAIALTLAHLML